MRNLSIFQLDLRVKDLIFSIFAEDSRMEVVHFDLGIILNLSHGSCIVFKIFLSFCVLLKVPLTQHLN